MATTTATPTAANLDEMKLLSDFYNLVTAREMQKNVSIEELVLTYNVKTGFSISLKETSKAAAQAAAEAGTQV